MTLHRHVATAAAGAQAELEFFAAWEKRGLRVRLRYNTHNPGEVTGYAMDLPDVLSDTEMSAETTRQCQ